MRTYVLRRLLQTIPVLLAVSGMIFILMRVAPGDVARAILLEGQDEGASVDPVAYAELRSKLGLDKPLPVQYWDWLSSAVRLDLGRSIRTDIPVWRELSRRMPVTLQLAGLTMLISFGLAVPAGVLMALGQDRAPDYGLRLLTITFVALPNFWVGTMVILIGMLVFNWIPPLILASPFRDPVENMKQMIWPALAMGTGSWGIVARMTRSSMLEVIRQDYIRTARAKGLSSFVIQQRHAIRNAALPVATVGGVIFATLLSGTVIMESIFSLQGVGSYLVDGIKRRDYPVVTSTITFYALLVVMVNLMIDLLYGWLDPRIRYE